MSGRNRQAPSSSEMRVREVSHSQPKAITAWVMDGQRVAATTWPLRFICVTVCVSGVGSPSVSSRSMPWSMNRKGSA